MKKLTNRQVDAFREILAKKELSMAISDDSMDIIAEAMNKNYYIGEDEVIELPAKMLMWDRHKESARERIVLSVLPGQAEYGYRAVTDGCEGVFDRGERYYVTGWENAKPVPKKTLPIINGISGEIITTRIST